MGVSGETAVKHHMYLSIAVILGNSTLFTVSAESTQHIFVAVKDDGTHVSGRVEKHISPHRPHAARSAKVLCSHV